MADDRNSDGTPLVHLKFWTGTGIKGAAKLPKAF
jgi:hypothetical protein